MDSQVYSRVLCGGLFLCGLLYGVASGQEVTSVAEETSSVAGQIGQRAAFPNVLGVGRSLPIERQISLPGLVRVNNPVVYVPSRVGVPAVVGSRGYLSDDGLRVHGRYEGDKFRLNFHLGTGSVLFDRGRIAAPVWPPHLWYSTRDGCISYTTPAWYAYRTGAYLSMEPVDGVLIQHVDSSLRAPAIAQPEPSVEPEREWTALERAYLLMAADELEEAIEAFRDHLDEDAEDVEAMRALGVAMIEAGRMEDGVAVIAMAYRTDPVLARSALDIEALGLNERRYDALLGRVLGFARRVDSGSAHLAGVVLLQADRKVAGASRVLDRATKAGLDEEIVDVFRRELGVPAHQ